MAESLGLASVARELFFLRVGGGRRGASSGSIGYLLLSSSFSSSSSPCAPFSPLAFPTRGIRPSSCSLSASAKPLIPKGPIFSEGREEDERRLVCPGCGIFMQDTDPDLPGYYRRKVVAPRKKKRRVKEAKRRDTEEDSVTVCARCHSLRNYGQVKNQKADNLIPDFDFDRLVTSRLMKPATSAPVVVMVVDCVDFDGSFPKRAVKSLFKALEGGNRHYKPSKLPKLVLVATKVDLLPSQISPTRLDRWVRNRAKAAGAPKLNAIYLVSARKDLGVKNLISRIKELAGPRGNVWVIGAQNAGKSTLINAFAKREGVKTTRLTEAAVPGTTLGILRIPGILPAKAKMYDTPGLLHPYLMTMRLTREEQKMVEIRKELQPRTFRMKASCSILCLQPFLAM
ncbi:hypothetical protein BHE74_00052451 [Ensete ventricosum]|nr:hypothetical protein BHE74_00052451 [Ensete ventricosum]